MRKFTIFCLNRDIRTTGILLLILTISLTYGCKSDIQNPTVQNSVVLGAWQETAVYNYTYGNNVLVKIDTIAIMTNKGTMYTVFKKDGTYEAYEVNGTGTIIDEIDEPYTYYPDKNLLEQAWPAANALTNTDKPNVGILSNGTFNFPTIPRLFEYTSVITSNSIKLSSQIIQYGNVTDGNYVIQVRQLNRY